MERIVRGRVAPIRWRPSWWRVPLLGGLAAIGLGACSLDPSLAPDGSGDRLNTLPRELSDAERRLATSVNDFTFALLASAAASEDEPNLVLSPLSASMALGMLLNGAAGSTRAELEQALRLEGMSAAEINAAYHDLIALLTALDDDVTLDIANAVFARQDVAFEPTFLDTVVAYFDATVRTLDFRDAGAPDVINEWVRANTNGRIDEMVRDIHPDAVMFLLNAIYFRGDWTRPFDPERTRDEAFRRADGSTVTVPMMWMDETSHAVARVDDAVALDLPYARGAFSMTLVLPPEDTPAMAWAASLDGDRWSRLVSALDSASVVVRLPRFTVEYERRLNDDLRALGIERAFTVEAEFAPLTPERVYVHEVKQKTYLAVDEVGTEAAAVTSIEMRVVSMPPSIAFDRPFVFVIRERLSNTILFAGVIGDPTD